MTVESLFQQFSQQLSTDRLAPLVQHYPEHAYTYFAKGTLAFRSGDWRRADQAFTQAYALQPKLWEALFYKARALEAQYCFVEAASLYEQVLSQHPQHMTVWQHLLALWQLLGEHERTQAVIASLVGDQGQVQWRDHPDYGPWCMRLEALSLLLRFGSEATTGHQLWRQAQHWYQRHLASITPISQPSSQPALPPSPGAERLKVGYLSSEWTSAAVELGYTGLFAYHARQQQFAVYALYPRGSAPPSEALTPYFENLLVLDHRHPSTYAAVFNTFDVVVDLSGWFHADAWPHLAAAGAPVKVLLASNPPFFAPGALFDAIVADAHVLPKSRQRALSSRFIAQASFFHWQPGVDLPQSLALAQQKSATKTIAVAGEGVFKFGVVASRNKINTVSLSLWARVLNGFTEAAQLTLKGLYYQDVYVQQQLRQAFAAAGGKPEQLAFEDNRQRQDLYAFFLEQDIILDTVPYSGALSTCDAYWAGTPVISLQSERGIARSLHLNTQTAELLADHADDFIEKTTRLAYQPAARKAYRTSLPAQLWHSPICQWQVFGAAMENLYGQLWQQKMQKKSE